MIQQHQSVLISLKRSRNQTQFLFFVFLKNKNINVGSAADGVTDLGHVLLVVALRGRGDHFGSLRVKHSVAGRTGVLSLQSWTETLELDLKYRCEKDPVSNHQLFTLEAILNSLIISKCPQNKNKNFTMQTQLQLAGFFYWA